MGLAEERAILFELKRLNEGLRDGLSAISFESRKQTALLQAIYKKLISGGGPLPVDPAVTGRFAFLDDNGQELRGKMELKANFKGVKKFRVSYADENGNAADVEAFALDQVNPELGLLVVEMKHVALGIYEGTMGISGKAGMSQISVKADGDLGAGQKEIVTVSEEINILPADAVLGKFEFLPDEEPVPVPVPTPIPEPVPVPAAKPLRSGASPRK